MNSDQKEILARLKAEHPALCKLIPQVEEAFALLKSLPTASTSWAS